MEQWKQILMASVNSEEVSILDADVPELKEPRMPRTVCFIPSFLKKRPLHIIEYLPIFRRCILSTTKLQYRDLKTI
jgi:hypothetical protein